MRARVTPRHGLLFAFAAGCAVTLALTRVVGTVDAQGGAATIRVCVAADGVLRQVTGPCPRDSAASSSPFPLRRLRRSLRRPRLQLPPRPRLRLRLRTASRTQDRSMP